MAGVILKCPRCVQPVIRRLDGSRITGFLPEALYVGYLLVARQFKVNRPPETCPNCGATLERREVTR